MHLILIQTICTELGIKYDIESLASSLIEDGGYDFNNVTAGNIVNALDGTGPVCWDNLAFGCGETLAYYQCISVRKTSDRQIVCALLNVLLLGMSLNKGCGAWGFEFDKIAAYLLHIKDRVEPECRMAVMRLALGDRRLPE